jgi:hypothetical protein
MCTRRIDENPAHQSSRRKEVCPIPPLDALAVNEPHEPLMTSAVACSV